MKYQFKKDQSEEFYRKLLLLDKVKPFLNYAQKEYIFNKGYCWDILFKDKDAPSLCFYYAKEIIKERFKEGEKYIAKNPELAYNYAYDVLEGRFELGEPYIAENTFYSFYYAKKIIEGRFELGEPSIARSVRFSYRYASHVLRDRFPLGEEDILNSKRWRDIYLRLLKDIGKIEEV